MIGEEVVKKSAMSRLCEGHASFVVHLEDFLDRIDIGSCSQVQSQVILHGRAHNLLEQRGKGSETT